MDIFGESLTILFFALLLYDISECFHYIDCRFFLYSLKGHLKKQIKIAYNIVKMETDTGVKIVQICKDGSMDEHVIESKALKSIETKLVSLSHSQGSSSFKELYQWSYKGGFLRCYGWYDGDAGFENKHELPPGGHRDSWKRIFSAAIIWRYILSYLLLMIF